MRILSVGIVPASDDSFNNAMQRLQTALDDIVRRTTWTSRHEPPVDANGLRRVYAQTAFSRDLQFVRYNYQPQMPDAQLEELSAQLRPLFRSNLDPDLDCIGNGLFTLTGGDYSLMRQPKVAQFAEVLVKPATILGSERVADLLLCWGRGGAVRFQNSAVLRGVTIDRDELRLAEGVRVWQLPVTSSDLPLSCPMGVSSHMGRCVLSFDCELSSAFHKPIGDPGPHPINGPPSQTVPASESMGSLTHDSFCEALSLACNRYIDWRIAWTDLERFGELQAFSEYPLGSVSKVSALEPPPLESPDMIVLSQARLERAREIHVARHTSGQRRKAVDLAIKWWLESKGSRSLEDKLIRLRIALEALYLNGANTELGFHLATRGAWYVGTNLEKRREHFITLKRFYGLASKVMHTGEKIKSTAADRSILSNAQEICRCGILKRLREVQEPKWDDLALGSSIE